MSKQLLAIIFTLLTITLSLLLTGFTLLEPSLVHESEEKVANLHEEFLVGDRGKRLFTFKCKACHSNSKRSTGPVLDNICDKYPSAEDKEWLFFWIRNSEEMIHEKKDPRAIALWEAYEKAPMSSFKKLTDQDIHDILEYVQPGCFGN